MARPISDEELQLRKRARRRLIGAIVLVTAVVVVLPMVLDSEPKPVSQDINIRIPSPDSGTFTSKVVPVAPDSKSAAKPPATVAAKPEAPPAVKETAKSVAVAEAAKAAAKSSAEADKHDAKALAEQFVVQVIALSNSEKAQQIQQQISAAGIKSYTEVVKTAKGDVTRVRAGPFATRDAAEKAREQLTGIGLDGKVAQK